MPWIYLLVAAFIAALVTASLVAQRAGYLRQFAIIAGTLAVFGYAAPILLAWKLANVNIALELAVSLIILFVLLPIVWRLFLAVQRQKPDKDDH